MLLTDPPYGTTRNFWDVPLPLPELWEAVKWAVKPEGAVLFFAQCPYDKVLGASNLAMLRYEWVWYKSRCTGFLNARRAPLKKTENILVFYQKSPAYFPQFEQGKPYKKIHRCSGSSPNYGEFERTSGESDGRRFPGNVLAFHTVTTTVHPTQKPVALCEYLIRTYTRPGEVVADICAGSGTTAVAALNGQWLRDNQKLSQKEQIRLAIDAALTERPKDFADFLRRMETAGIQVKHGRGGVISFLVPGQQRAARFRASTLGDGYGPEDVQAVIDGKAPTRTAPARRTPMPRRVNLLIDIQERMRQGKGPAYERWAKVYNLKQMAAALQYLKEHQLFEYDDLAAKTDAATERFHTLAGDIQQTEAELSRVSDLMAAVVQYAKTRPAFDGYTCLACR